MITHIESFGAFHAYLGGEDSVSCGIVRFDRCTSKRLRMTHFDESGDDGAGFLSTQKDAASFCFSCRCWDSRECFDKDMEWAIMLGDGWMGSGKVGEGVHGGAATACCWEDEVGSITNHMENHVAGIVSDGSVWMSVQVVK